MCDNNFIYLHVQGPNFNFLKFDLSESCKSQANSQLYRFCHMSIWIDGFVSYRGISKQKMLETLWCVFFGTPCSLKKDKLLKTKFLSFNFLKLCTTILQSISEGGWHVIGEHVFGKWTEALGAQSQTRRNTAQCSSSSAQTTSWLSRPLN